MRVTFVLPSGQKASSPAGFPLQCLSFPCVQSACDRKISWKFLRSCTRIPSRSASCRLPTVYEDLLQSINAVDADKDLRWWSQTHGVDMSMNWPDFEVRHGAPLYLPPLYLLDYKSMHYLQDLLQCTTRFWFPTSASSVREARGRV